MSEIKYRLFGIPLTEEEYHYVESELRQRIVDTITVQSDDDAKSIMTALETYAADKMVEQKLGVTKRIEVSTTEIQSILARAKLYTERGKLDTAMELLKE